MFKAFFFIFLLLLLGFLVNHYLCNKDFTVLDYLIFRRSHE